jgi:hypothetical protein
MFIFKNNLKITAWIKSAVLYSVVLSSSYAASQASVTPLSIETSYSRQAFSPERNESVSIRYNISKPADLVLTIEGPDGREWYTQKQTAKNAGRGEFIWKGVDAKGNKVPPEAYRFHVIASANKEKVTNNYPGIMDGMKIDASQITLDRATGEIKYLLRKPARVRVLAKLAENGVPLGTLEDWNARPAGMHTVHIDLDYFTQFFGEQAITPIIQSWSLPANAIIVLPKSGVPKREQFLAYENKPAAPQKPWYTDADGLNIEQHATHPYSQCYDPKVTLTPLEKLDESNGAWVINRTSTIRIEVPREQGEGLAEPIPRYSLFLYVDDRADMRILPSYLPFQLKIDPTKYAAGDHVITAMLTWRDDHIAVKHIKFHIPREMETN